MVAIRFYASESTFYGENRDIRLVLRSLTELKQILVRNQLLIPRDPPPQSQNHGRHRHPSTLKDLSRS